MKLSIGKHLIFDSDREGWHLSDMDGSIERVIQESAPIRAEEIQTFYRGVKKTDLTFTISRAQADEAATLEELFFHERDIPETGNITIVGRTRDGRERTMYLRGKLKSVRFWHDGTRTWHSYRIIGGKPRSTAPR